MPMRSDLILIKYMEDRMQGIPLSTTLDSPGRKEVRVILKKGPVETILWPVRYKPPRHVDRSRSQQKLSTVNPSHFSHPTVKPNMNSIDCRGHDSVYAPNMDEQASGIIPLSKAVGRSPHPPETNFRVAVIIIASKLWARKFSFGTVGWCLRDIYRYFPFQCHEIWGQRFPVHTIFRLSGHLNGLSLYRTL